MCVLIVSYQIAERDEEGGDEERGGGGDNVSIKNPLGFFERDLGKASSPPPSFNFQRILFDTLILILGEMK